MDKTRVFALDIGTRKIIGLVMEKLDRQYKVIDAEMLEHSTRAMMDGQIHDVTAVAATIKQIKDALEARLQIKLKSAAVAAAGRALKTSPGDCRKSRSILTEISSEEIRALEIEAVHKAQYNLAQEEQGGRERNNYFCVGYSVVEYSLEGQPISNLQGQVGNEIAVQVIATFLPRVVVDSLFSSLKKAGLEIESLTLEPIAALAVAIPPAMRLLNLALVDIGAGTSDIALVKDGNVFAYAMVPTAGDELTEYLATRYLLDFDTAENTKRRLTGQDQIEITDILNNRQLMSSRDLCQELQPLVDELTNEIAHIITGLNQKVPDAVVCVGGGSLTPSLTASLADKLGIPANRVGIRTVQNLDYIHTDKSFLNGPQGITPLGIAYNYFTIPPIPFIKVSVNGRETALWNMGELSVAAALLSSGIALNNIYGKPGMGKTVEINGFVRVIKGSMGTAPLIKVNGETGSLETRLQDGDSIEFTPGRDGEEARLTGRDLVPGIKGQVKVNGELYEMEPVITVNGEPSDPDAPIPDRARLEFANVNSVYNILRLSGLDDYWLREKHYRYYLDDRKITVTWMPIEVQVNGLKAEAEQQVEPGAQITYSRKPLHPSIGDLLAETDYWGINVKVNGEEVRIPGKGASIEIDGQTASIHDEIRDGAHITLNRDKGGAILSDIFKVIEIKPAANARLLLKVDGEAAGFTTPIREGSEIEIRWE